MNQLAHYFTTLHLHASAMPYLVAVFGTVLPVLLQLIKHKFVVGDRFVLRIFKHQVDFDAKRMAVALLGLLSFSASAATDYLSYTSQSLGTVAGNAALIFAVATYVHRFAVSPIYHRLVDLLDTVNAYFAAKEAAPDTSSSGTPSA